MGELTAWRECQDCGLFQLLPAIPDGEAGVCVRCDAVLRRVARDSVALARTNALVAALLFALALSLPLVDLSVLGRFSTSTLFTGPSALRSAGLPFLGLAVLATLVVLPALKLALELAVLFGVLAPRPPRWLARLFRWEKHLSPWAMVDVFLLGSFVAYTRLKVLAHVDVGLAAPALAGVLLTMVALDATLDREAIWRELDAKAAQLNRPRATPVAGDDSPTSSQASSAAVRAARQPIACDECGRVTRAREEDPCPRCAHALSVRKGGLDRVWALVLTAALLYVPANVLPVMTVKRLEKGGPSTILNGVIELGKNHLWPLAILVLFASIIIPVVKLLSLLTMLVMTQRRSAARLVGRTRLFRFVKFIGRWSMIDVFMLSVLVGVVRLGAIASVTPGLGAVAFCAVVLVTMAATELFDPRLMWDAAGVGTETGA